MFEVPAAKRLKRADLIEDRIGNEIHASDYKALSTVTNDTTGSQKIDYGFEYEFIEQPTEQRSPENLEKDVFQFNLFKPKQKPVGDVKPQRGANEPNSEALEAPISPSHVRQQQTPILVSIRSPSPAPILDYSQSSFQRERPNSFYFTGAQSEFMLEAQRDAFTETATSGEELLATSRSQYWPGTHLAWRVINLPCHSKQIVVHNICTAATKAKEESDKSFSLLAAHSGVVTRRRQARPSRKVRLALKEKVARRQRIIDESKTKEEHEREKRNKKNRDRKLKRRAKERREKEGKSVRADSVSENSQ